jgi:hypothetical protein
MEECDQGDFKDNGPEQIQELHAYNPITTKSELAIAFDENPLVVKGTCAFILYIDIYYRRFTYTSRTL